MRLRARDAASIIAVYLELKEATQSALSNEQRAIKCHWVARQFLSSVAAAAWARLPPKLYSSCSPPHRDPKPSLPHSKFTPAFPFGNSLTSSPAAAFLGSSAATLRSSSPRALKSAPQIPHACEQAASMATTPPQCRRSSRPFLSGQCITWFAPGERARDAETCAEQTTLPSCRSKWR